MASSPKTLKYLTGISILTIAFLSLCCPSPVLAADSFSDQSAQKIGKLEEKFFQHSYPKDEPEARLERLEKLIFGGSKTGTVSDRLNALVTAVPVVETKADNDSNKAATAADAEGKTSHKASGLESQTKSANRDATAAGEGASDYPAVTAMERKALGKEYLDDPIGQRLGRLETKEFGRPSTSTDLSERVDRLKQRIGIDIARLAPAGSDWAEDDEEDGMSMPIPAGGDSIGKLGEDGKSFSGKDLRSDMRRAFGGMSGTRSYSGPSGAYGMGSSGLSGGGGSGAYGFGGSSAMSGLGNSASAGLSDRQDEDIPSVAPPVRPKKRSMSDPSLATTDLPSQVSALEKEIFGKTHASDPLLTRLNRLETAVFPQQKPKVDEPLPDRVKQLLAVVPVSVNRVNPKGKHADPDLDDSDLGVLQGSNSQVQQPHGLGKIINSLSNMLGGGNVGGYPMQSQSYVTDPQTGMLIDQYTGNTIDPNTGVVITRTPIYGGSGLGNYGGFGSFNNGFAPFGSPYGTYGSPYGTYGSPYGNGMGSGVHFGFGGGRLGGIWP